MLVIHLKPAIMVMNQLPIGCVKHGLFQAGDPRLTVVSPDFCSACAKGRRGLIAVMNALSLS